MIKPDQTILEMNAEAFGKRPQLSRNLGELAFRGLAKRPFRPLVVDLATGRKELKAGMLLAVSIVLAQRWRHMLKGDRIGVIFPAGLGGIITNLALTLLGKEPVNFNFTAGRRANEIAIKKSGVDTIITAGPVIERLEDFPWPENVIDLVKERKQVQKADVVKWLAAIVALPAGLLLRRLKVPRDGGDRVAGLLFSSGSTGDPKGIPLTHRNIASNCMQIADCELLNPEETMLANLPTFHSFGFTVTLWYPLLYGIKIVCLPSPLETKRIAQAIQDEKVTVMMGTPTFYRPYFKRATKEQLESLKFVVAGAEKTPPGFAERWEQHFGSSYFEGYGLTETSPVVSSNLPPTAKGGTPEMGGDRSRPGAVGHLFPGMKAMIVDPATLKPKPLLERGILCVQGPNVFNGYLDDDHANEVAFKDGWFITGDLARFDEDGFLYIQGRVSRFSKIGGEMVPHGTVEQTIMRAFHLEESDEPLVAVTGITDEAKGESLVLLSAVEITAAKLRDRLTQEGVPNLWIPRRIKRVDHIPCLASGKLDLRALDEMARQ